LRITDETSLTLENHGGKPKLAAGNPRAHGGRHYAGRGSAGAGGPPVALSRPRPGPVAAGEREPEEQRDRQYQCEAAEQPTQLFAPRGTRLFHLLVGHARLLEPDSIRSARFPRR